MRTDTRPAYIKWAYAAGVAIVLGSAGMAMDGPSAQDEAEATELALQDALKQAQAENPKGWTAEQIARGDVAAQVAAQHTGAQR